MNSKTDQDAESDRASLLKPEQKNINQTTDVNLVTSKTGGQTLDQEAKRKKYIKWGIIGAIILIIVVLAIVLPIVLTNKGGGDNPTPTPVPPIPPGENPYHLDEKDVQNDTYALKGVIRSKSPSSLKSTFNKLLSTQEQEPVNLGVNLTGISVGAVNNKFTQNLSFSIGLVGQRCAHFVLTDNDDTRFEIPDYVVPKPQDDQSLRLDMIGFKYNLNPFSFSFSDPTETSNVFVTTEGQTLFFLDKYIQMDFKLPSQKLYGFGERVHEFGLTEGTWTMWSSAQNAAYDDGTGRLGLYSVHPFVLIQGKNKNDFIGMYFRNSNFQTPILSFNDDGSSLLSYITTGGILDVYMFMHGTPKDIIQQYQNYFGKPQLPPFWSLGWQQASYKWDNQSIVEQVIANYSSNGFPLETIMLDIPYMSNYETFTVNNNSFPSITNLSKSLHDNNQRLVLIIDTAISANTSSKYYTMANDDKVLIKSAISNSEVYGDNLVSKTWIDVVFVDFFNDKCMNVWSTGLGDLYNETLYDGIWIDLNEPATANVNGETPNIKKSQTIGLNDYINLKRERFLVEDTNTTKKYDWYTSFDQSGIKTTDTWFLPFVPQYEKAQQNFDSQTISLNATHNSSNLNATQYNLHSLYGHQMTYRTWQHLTTNHTNKDQRPFVLTRSTFTSSGKYGSHWLGDNFRSWEYMNYSISGIMNFNMFGIPHTGSDVCGFNGTVRDDELCTRWIQLGQFYPLARLHYINTSEYNEPYNIQEPYKSLAKKAMLNRYQYLRQLYTCLFEANKYGGTCFDPLLYYFPTDDKVYEEVESTFMFAGALKVTPVLAPLGENETTREAYFPDGTWVNLKDYSYFNGSQNVNLSVVHDINVHQKEGTIVAFQDNSDGSIKTTADLAKKPISLYINRDSSGFATGSLFLDQGISRSELDDGNYEYYQFSMQAGSMQFLITEGKRGTQNHVFNNLRIFNASDLASSQACVVYMNQSTDSLNVNQLDNDAVDVSADKLIRFNEIHSVFVAPDLSMTPCALNEYIQYSLDSNPDLDTNNVTFNLTHSSLPDISVQLQLLSDNTVNIRWTWKESNNSKRTVFDVPQDIISTDKLNLSTSYLSTYVSISTVPYLQINVTDRSGNTLFSIVNLIYDEYFNFVKTRAFTSRGVFGLGERANKDFFYKDGVYGLYTRDAGTPDETGQLPGNNMYGVHPIYMYKQASSSWVGVFHKIVQAQDWWIKNQLSAGYVELSQIAIGGVMDIYVMQQTTPDKVVASYHGIVGKPVLTPQWALGWNQCKWGYRTLDEVKTVVGKYENYSLPLDVQWSDIDYLNQYRNFEYDQVNYNGLPAFIDELHKKNMRWVPILDAGLAYRSDGSYQAFKDGVDQDVFMKIQDDIFIGQVWPNDAAYPDYFAANTVKWWQTQMTKMWNMIPFDGLWEDMNEASNFCNGVCYDKQKVSSPAKQKLRYIPTARNLEYKSMALDAKHANGFQQLDTHSLYGTQMVKTSHEWFANKGNRTFIIERSSFAGSGKFTSRWLGDNEAKWSHMAYSVTGIMLMNIFGIPLSGADICGFGGNTNAALCTKWHLVGAFYPFSRNHNAWGQIAQEPWEWENSTVGGDKKNALDVMRDAIKTKYSLIRYYYQNLFTISTNGTGTFYKPMFFEFPDDENAYTDIVYNIMLGDSIKLSINPEIEDLTTKDYYFPAGLWCALNGTGLSIGDCFTSSGQNKTFKSDVTDYQFHIRQGKIVPMQNTFNDSLPFRTSADLQSWPVDFHVLGQPDSSNASLWYAYGSYVNDDGLTLDYAGKYNKYDLSVAGTGNITINIANSIAATNSQSKQENCTAINQNDYLQNIYIYNAQGFNLTKDMKVQAQIYPNATTMADVGDAVYNATTNRLIVSFNYSSQTSLCLSTIGQIVLY